MKTNHNTTRQESKRKQIHRQSARKSYGKKKPRYNYPRIAALVLGIIFLALLLLVVLRSCSKPAGNLPEATATEAEIMQQDIIVNGTSIKGLDKEEAKNAILADMDWALKVSYGSETYQLPNLYESKVEEILSEVYDSHSSSVQTEYRLDDVIPEEKLVDEVAAVADMWDIPAKDAGISGYDASANKFLFSEGEPGKIIDQNKLLQELKAAMKNKSYASLVEAKGLDSLPKLLLDEAKAGYKIIGTFTTKTTTNQDRNKNITLACAAINGKIVEKGDVFSINDATGERTIDRGYKAAGAYVNGVLVEEPGGGVCQVSSTLYNAVIYAGLNTTERYSHSYVSSYVIAGEDAMISYPNLDMKFENDTIDSIGILASLNGTTLTISIYGIPVLEEGITREMYSETKSELPLEVPNYVEDPSLEFGTEVVDKEAVAGIKVVTYLVTKKNGVEISREFLHNSTYKGKPATVRRNTDPNAVVSPEETLEGESTENTDSQTEGPLDTTGANHEESKTAANATEAVPVTTETSGVENPDAE